MFIPPVPKTHFQGVVGLVPMTSGEATVCGYDVRTELESVRRNISVCPQDREKEIPRTKCVHGKIMKISAFLFQLPCLIAGVSCVPIFSHRG